MSVSLMVVVRNGVMPLLLLMTTRRNDVGVELRHDIVVSRVSWNRGDATGEGGAGHDERRKERERERTRERSRLRESYRYRCFRYDYNIVGWVIECCGL